jgi:signal transduction histidine kinase
VLVGRSALPPKNLAELVQYMRVRSVNVAHAGVGTTGYITTALFLQQAKLDALLVPYRGAAPALQDMIGNHVDLFFTTPQAVLPLIGAGQRWGWLALARPRGPLSPAAQAIARELAPLIALRLVCDQAAMALEQQQSKLAELEQQLSITSTLRIRAMLAAGTAHNIGNLFTNVLGHAQLLEQDVPALFRPDVRVIIRAVDDGRQLLHRLQLVKSELSPDAFGFTSLQSIVQETIQLTRPFWEVRSGIDIETAFDQSLAVRARSTDVREVLVNLIMNAVAAMPAGGVITIYCFRKGDQAAVAVSDTGQGIARELHSAIFQPLTSTRAEGSGLGLSVSRMIVEGYGGTLTVESAPGHGATFTVTLPIA